MEGDTPATLTETIPAHLDHDLNKFTLFSALHAEDQS